MSYTILVSRGEGEEKEEEVGGQHSKNVDFKTYEE